MSQGPGFRQRVGRVFAAALLALAVALPPATVPAAAAGGDRTLYLHHTHTGETAQITFKRNGRYDQEALRKLNYFLRDWRTNEPTNMDPALFDLVWQVYQSVGATQPINIVSSYRAPKTNAMLRATSSGVAENSQHMKGKAMDFFIPGIDLPTLRATAMKFQVGGVGYYPTSGSPFVHLDTGSVRAWPRMTTAQLKKVFPDGKTLHLPADGKPLSDSGRKYAMAEWQKCRSVPCGIGEAVGGKGGGGNLFDSLFGRKQDQVVQVADTGPAQRAVQIVDVVAPMPASARPDDNNAIAVASAETPAAPSLPFGSNASAPLTTAELGGGDMPAPVPMQKSERLMVATRGGQPGETGETAVLALAALEAPVPAPRPRNDTTLMTAYAPAGAEAQTDLETIISAETTASLPPRPAIDAGNLRTASLGGTTAKPGGVLNGLFDTTWKAVGTNTSQAPVAQAVKALAASHQPLLGVTARDVELVAPDLDHVAEIFAQPEKLTSATYGVLWEPDEADLDPATELGPYVNRLVFTTGAESLDYSRFVTGRALVVASR